MGAGDGRGSSFAWNSPVIIASGIYTDAEADQLSQEPVADQPRQHVDQPQPRGHLATVQISFVVHKKIYKYI